MPNTILATYGGQPIKINVDLQYRVEDGKVNITNFVADNLEIISLMKTDDTTAHFKQLFSPSNQENTTNYGRGEWPAEKVQFLINMWGSRAEGGEAYRCLVAVDRSAPAGEDSVVGFFNIGFARMADQKGFNLHEAGALFHAKYGNTDLPVKLVASALHYFNMVTTSHPENGHEDPVIKGNHLIYTSKDAHTIQTLQEAGMPLVDSGNPTIEYLVSSNPDRFSAAEGVFKESGVEKTLFEYFGDFNPASSHPTGSLPDVCALGLGNQSECAGTE